MIQELVQMALRMFVRAPIFFVGGSIMMSTLDIEFSVVAFIGLPLLLLLIFLFLRKVTPLFSIVQKKLDRVNSVVQENVSGARVIKAYVREDYENERFDKANKDFYDVNLRVMMIMCFLSPLMMIVMNLAVVVVIYLGGLKTMKAGDVMAAVSYLTQIFHSAMMVNMMFQSLSRAGASAKRINEVLDSDPIIVTGDKTTSGESEIHISFKGVDFYYPGASGRPVLNNINLDVKRGETLAVIGSTGSGKSSLVKLIPRFYDVTAGDVLIDGESVKNYDLDALRGKIGFVMQKSELFSDTVAENIRWGKNDATDEEVVAAARVAQADSFISDFADGYSTFIAEKGASLSGGQKQRVSIARAVVRKPEILILDDSTSALDLATESRLRSALKEEMKGTTVIMIAQRIASVKEADRIAVIDKGSIVACDTHENLLKTSEAYREIYLSQMKSGAYAEGGEA
jgi:ATP-binding cassette subfamily B protein